MNYFEIKKIQRKYGVGKVQELIDSGKAFMIQGDFEELIWSMIYSGACMLPDLVHKNHQGTRIATRAMVPSGSPGSFKRCQSYWSKFIAATKPDWYE